MTIFQTLKEYCIRIYIFLIRGRINRHYLQKHYLHGEGIEIGALHNPLRLASHVKVKYVDRLSNEVLREHYPELQKFNLVHVDIIDDGETLGTIANHSQDFVIANHFLEHCQNPILAIENMVRVVKKTGVVFMVIPDKRYTFDVERPVTTIEHLSDDYNNGPQHSQFSHFEEWVRIIGKINDPKEIERHIKSLQQTKYSIHFHVWTQQEILELLLMMRKKIDVEIELFFKNEGECICVLKKN